MKNPEIKLTFNIHHEKGLVGLDFDDVQEKANLTLTISQFKAVVHKYRKVIPVNVIDYINLVRFAA